MAEENDVCVVTVLAAWKRGPRTLRFWILSQFASCWTGIAASVAGMDAYTRGDQVARFELLGVVCLCVLALHHAKRVVARQFGITLR